MGFFKNLVPLLPGSVVALFQTGLQVSNFTNPTVTVVLWTVAGLLMLAAGCYYASEWQSKRKAAGMIGLDSWYFIAPCIVIALIAVSAAAYGFGLRTSSGSPQEKSEVKEWFSVVDAIEKFPLNGQRGFASLQQQLKGGSLIARGFPFPAATDVNGPTIIDVARWQYLQLDARDGEAGKAGGGMSSWVGVQIGQPASSVKPPVVRPSYVENIKFVTSPGAVSSGGAQVVFNPSDYLSRLRVYIEFSASELPLGNPAQWGERHKILLADLSDVTKGEVKTVQMIYEKHSEGQQIAFWWGNPAVSPTNATSHIGRAKNKARIYFVGPDNKEQKLKIVVLQSMYDVPSVTLTGTPALIVFDEKEINSSLEWPDD